MVFSGKLAGPMVFGTHGFFGRPRPAEIFWDSPPQAIFFRVIYHLYREKMLGKHVFSNVSGERRAAGEKKPEIRTRNLKF